MSKTRSYSQLLHKGSFSFLQDDVNYVTIDANTSIHIERIDEIVARVFLVRNGAA
jgi:hypothetical protein